ncbi:hypothetical protein ACFVRD_36135 [Streptomyces sp. NPDC057908]|uniref:hypothetical protein n=1 Tax=Streptomyces sp. NPDC057908 TaxID=3346276 RepID=UPI0036ED1E6F
MGAVSRDGPVRNLDGAERAAGRFADRWDPRVGEVMEFSNGYYTEFLTPDGKGATKVFIDPGNGSVQLKFGPAMMWNAAYGMMPARHQTGVSDDIIGMLYVNACTGAVWYHTWHGPASAAARVASRPAPGRAAQGARAARPSTGN